MDWSCGGSLCFEEKHSDQFFIVIPTLRKFIGRTCCLLQGFALARSAGQTQVLSAKPLSNCSSERINNVDHFFARGLRKFLLRLCSRPEGQSQNLSHCNQKT